MKGEEKGEKGRESRTSRDGRRRISTNTNRLAKKREKMGG